jgi:lipopolysaccharide transport system permease protein
VSGVSTLSGAAWTRITPTGSLGLGLRELWEYRELVWFLVWRDLTLRYRQTLLGAAWAILQPLATTVVFSLVFGRLARMPSDGVPYPLWSFAGLLPWMYFANALTQASMSLVGSANLITKVYFPRLAIPLAATLGGLLDLGIGLVVLAGVMALYGVAPGPAVLLLPLVVLLAVAAAVGVGLWLSALNVQYRDVRFAVPFLIQFWLFATPVVYPSSLLPGAWRPVAGINPMAGVVELFRWAALGPPPSVPLVIASCVVIAVVLVTGVLFFRRVEERFADVI